LPIHADGEEASSATPSKGKPLATRVFLQGPSQICRQQFCRQPIHRQRIPRSQSPQSSASSLIIRRAQNLGSGFLLEGLRPSSASCPGAAQEQRSATNMTSSTRTKQGRPLRPTSLRNGCRGEITSSQWSDIEHPLRDNVDMPVPSHYSAAPSGDLCTTYKSQFVVWGESRRSVSITNERPLPPRPELSRSPKALSQKEWSGRFSTSVGALAMECSSMTACALELRAAASNGAEATACSSAKNAGGEQMKHGSVDTGRRREHSGYRWLSHRWTRSASTGRASLRDGLPRNSFFT